MSALTIAEDEIEEGAYVEWTTSGGMIRDDTESAGIVKEIVTEYNHALEDEQTFVILADGDEESRVNITHFENDDEQVQVTVYQPQSTDDDEEDDDDEGKLVTDGGTDQSAPVTDEEIKEAIEAHDGPLDHPETSTVEEIRDALGWIQQSITEHWGEWCSNLENQEVQVVEDDGDVIVFGTGDSESVPRRELEYYDGDLNERAGDIVNAIHHELARDRTDYDWGYEYPLVVQKPAGAEDGQRYVEGIINSLLSEGLSPGQAWAAYGVHVLGHSRNKWATRCGYNDHSAISEPLRKAEKKAGHLGLFK